MLLERKTTLFELCRSLEALQEFDTIEQVIVNNEKHSNVHISFQRKLGMIMVLFEHSDDFDYYPINRFEISDAKIKQNDYHVRFFVLL